MILRYLSFGFSRMVLTSRYLYKNISQTDRIEPYTSAKNSRKFCRTIAYLCIYLPVPRWSSGKRFSLRRREAGFDPRVG